MLPFSDALLSETIANGMWGRGYTSEFGSNHSNNAIRMGLNFEEQWHEAIGRDLKYTFVTGWNEWVAIKFIGRPGGTLSGNPNRVFFVDTVNEEFSRDVEMMKGGYKDNVYLQMLRNTRSLKGNPVSSYVYNDKNSVDIKKGMSQWHNINNVYYDMINEGNRNYLNFARNGYYTDESLLNDIEEIRVTHDDDNLYFLIKCTDNINVNLDSQKFMNLLIDVEGQSDKPLYGYDYLINRQINANGKSSVEKFNYERGQFNFQSRQNADFTVNQKYMQVKISKAALGIGNGQFRINFKVADNVSDLLDIQNFYLTGDVAPYGRINYSYFGK